MPAYYDEKQKTWYCKFYYGDWQGHKKQKLKRGFKLQRDAKDWERKFLELYSKSPDITFESLYEKYKAFIAPRVRESTFSTRIFSIDKHVLPFFRDRAISDITPADIAAWQTEILNKNMSDTYTRNINANLSSIFNYAVDYVGLPKNPCNKHIGSSQTKKIDFWTPEEYKLFSEACHHNIEYFTIFEILYYTGIRVGELLALTLNDVDLNHNYISINKTLYKIKGKTLINPPKTKKSERTVDIPEFLKEEISNYVSCLYQPDPEGLLFPRGTKFIRLALNKTAQMAGIKKIRVHDIRHSHASLLINLGANPVLIAERLGHESPDITLKTYSHLFPSSQADIIHKIDTLKK